MALKIRKLGDNRYEAEASPPHTKEQWQTPEPLGLRELIEELQNRGCHQTDIAGMPFTRSIPTGYHISTRPPDSETI
jgi:hypothetical protein